MVILLGFEHDRGTDGRYELIFGREPDRLIALVFPAGADEAVYLAVRP